ncbi:hypothetical protein KC332_g9515 [Hortaea werneckii]|uniref:Cytochrome P450 n=1 Tax=Hortaea werneckii TaxID=91943 RepID=A0A3M7ITN3_HORWE|nr:hypothetical protein KC358_g8875 [Hortaea werneckii]KAI6827217.1 hypothetical protein KC350_g8345 [Hortaea werneckii]KAI6917722.1 hypothetical protein KC348_g11108 [Hortaea werneckii]KAI6929858.1 hypothetical protein KC341_g10610 [Hortaea werneckii]KAI6970376.1 hypothetical protein KC321_g7351 [Hortaea werneckii]
MTLGHELQTLGTSTLISGAILTVILAIAYTYITTLISFHFGVASRTQASEKNPTRPPLIPYVIPGLGSAIDFSNQKIGHFWSWLRTQSKRYNQEAFSILLAGTRTNFIYSVEGITATFKSRQLSRSGLDQQLGINALGMSKEDAKKAFPADLDAKGKLSTAKIHTEHLLSASAVNSLTVKFLECFVQELQNDPKLKDGAEVNLYEWLWQRIFHASTTSLYGSKLLEMFPDFDKDYKVWEDNMLGLLFGVPRFMIGHAYKARDSNIKKLTAFLEEGYRNESEGDADWDPWFGARVVRKRHEYYHQQDLSTQGQAGCDLVFLAGILSNATPATGWLLAHLLSPTSPPDLLPRVMEELKSAQRPDGSVDVLALTKLPLLNSAFHETLRLYVDLLIVRQVDSSVTLAGQHHVRQGEHVMAPSWMTHRDPNTFAQPDAFDPERFLSQDPETGKLSYNTSRSAGSYFPFGGGHYMCPGRIFAKQEVLGSVATLLLNLDVTFVEFVHEKGGRYSSAGRGGENFPALKDNYAGNQVVGMQGDLKVRLKAKA